MGILEMDILLLISLLSNMALTKYMRPVQDRSNLQLRSLDLGPCLHEGDSFCTRRVANSMCSKEKNECFCKPGFVSIQENYGITCKTLLTNLPCQVDADCTHVSQSACHPGAGLCACPGGTIYVAQEHGCYLTEESNDSLFCRQCRQTNGVCYRKDGSEWTNNSHSAKAPMNTNQFIKLDILISKIPYGCKCPYNTGMPKSIPLLSSIKNNTEHSPSSDSSLIHHIPQWSFCKAILVDIGEYCNNIDLLCRTKSAKCTSVDSPGPDAFPSSCQCLPNYIAVFQQYLQYYECFPRIPANHSSCVTCSKTGGQCYTMDTDRVASVECLCPHHRSSHISVSDGRRIDEHFPSEDAESGCSETLAEVTCSRNYVELCYKTPTYHPYHILSRLLMQQNAVAFVADSRMGFPYEFGCGLSSVPTDQLKRELRREFAFSPLTTNNEGLYRIWCVKLDWRNDQTNPPCGLKLTEYMSGNLYSGYLAILINPEKRTHLKDLLFHFTCKTKNELLQQVAGQISESPWSRNIASSPVLFNGSTVRSNLNNNINFAKWNSKDNTNLPWSQTELLTEIRNSSGHALETVFEGTPIQIHARLDERPGPYVAFQVEKCYMADVTERGNEFSDAEQRLVIDKGCPTNALKLHEHLNPPSPAHLQKSEIAWLDDLTVYRTPLFLALPLYNCDLNCSTNANARYEGRRSQSADYLVHRIQVRCIFRLCTEHAWCSWPTSCPDQIHRKMEPRATFLPPSIRLTTYTVVINVVELLRKGSKLSGMKLPNDICQSFWCADRLQISLIIVTIILLTCCMGILGLFLARHYKKRYNFSGNHVHSSPSIKHGRSMNGELNAPNTNVAYNSALPAYNQVPTLKRLNACALNLPTEHQHVMLHAYSNPLGVVELPISQNSPMCSMNPRISNGHLCSCASGDCSSLYARNIPGEISYPTIPRKQITHPEQTHIYTKMSPLLLSSTHRPSALHVTYAKEYVPAPSPLANTNWTTTKRSRCQAIPVDRLHTSREGCIHSGSSSSGCNYGDPHTIPSPIPTV